MLWFKKPRKITLPYVPSDDEWALQSYQASVNEVTVPLGKTWRCFVDQDGVCHDGRLELWNYVTLKGQRNIVSEITDVSVKLFVDHRLTLCLRPAILVIDTCVKRAGWLRYVWRTASTPLDECGNDAYRHAYWCNSPAMSLVDAIGAQRAYDTFKDCQPPYS